MPKDDKKTKILFVCTEDWFFLSHFLPLIEAAHNISNAEIILVTTSGDKTPELEQKGIRIIPVDFARASLGLANIFLLTRLVGIFAQEKPNIIHFIALKPVLMGGIVCLLTRFRQLFAKSAKRIKPLIIWHVTGLGTLAEGRRLKHKILGKLVLRLPVIYQLMFKDSHLLVENPDDLNFLYGKRRATSLPHKILGGAGIDPKAFPLLPFPEHQHLELAFVGRMIWTKGVDILVKSMEILVDKHPDIHLGLYGGYDTANPGYIQETVLQEWNARPNISWYGHTDNILDVWQRSDICIVSTRTREGLPRAMLEAAACGRPLIVTDVPGCRHFVKSGREGLVVPPEDAEAMAKAIEKFVTDLTTDKALLVKMGQAARDRVLAGFTKQHVIEAVTEVYLKVLSPASGKEGQKESDV